MTMHMTVDGCRLSFSVTGPEQAPALLLLGELDAAHLANVERPEAFNAAVIEFLTH